MKALFLALTLFFGTTFAQDYSGTFVQEGDPSTVMTLQVQNEGYIGTLLNSGTDEFGIEALPQEGYLAGYLRGESIGFDDLFFLAELTAEGLNFMVAPLDEKGNPIESSAEVYTFMRQDMSGQNSNPLGSSAPSTQNPLATPSQSDMFAGDYEGQAFNLSLQATATGYSGSIVMNAQTYPVEAQAAGNALTGAFSANGQTFSFQAELTGNTLTLISDGQTYTLTKAQSSANPLASSSQSPLGSSPVASSPVIANGAYADLTEDNALAVFEAYAFSLQQLGYTQTLSEADKQHFLTLAVQSYPSADQETQVTLARAREVWTQVQTNWANASLEEQRGFVLAVLSLVHGEEAVQQSLGQNTGGQNAGGSAQGNSGSGLSSLGCSSVESCMQTLNPEGYQDMVNAQSCWAGAGCESYDADSNTFYEEPDYSYDVPSYDYGD